jgi:hypothetical protein
MVSCVGLRWFFRKRQNFQNLKACLPAIGAYLTLLLFAEKPGDPLLVYCLFYGMADSIGIQCSKLKVSGEQYRRGKCLFTRGASNDV